MLSSRHLATFLVALSCIPVGQSQVLPAAILWANVGTEFTSAANWTGGTILNDATSTIAVFGSPAVLAQPNLGAPFSVAGVRFSGSAGSYTLSATATNALTLGAFGIENQTTSGAQEISAPLVFSTAASITNQGELTITGPVSSNGTSLTLDGSGFSSVISGPISGAGKLVKNGTGTWTLTGTNTYTGTTLINGGTLEIGDGGATGSLTGSVQNYGELSFNRSGTVSASGISGPGKVSQNGLGTLTLGGTNSYSGETLVNAGTVSDANAGAFSPASAIRLTEAGVQLNINYAETIAGLGGAANSVGSTTNLASILTIKNAGLVYNGTIAGTGAVVINGPGSQTFGGDNTYSGGTTINGGVLIATNATGSATGSGNITIAGGAALQFGNNGAGGMVSGNISSNGNVFFARTDTATYAGVISGAGGLTVGSYSSGTTGTLTLVGQNSYSGTTNISSGTLVVGTPDALPTSGRVWLDSYGTLQVANNQKIGQLDANSYGATVEIIPDKTLTLSPVAGGYGGTFAGSLTGSGTLVLAGGIGSGLTVSGDNFYFAGNTTVSGGTLYVGRSTSLGTGTLTLLGGGLAVSKSAMSGVEVPNAVSLASGVTLGGGKDDQALKLSGNVTIPTGGASITVADLVEFSGTVAAPTASPLSIVSAPGGFGYALFSGTLQNISSITPSNAGVIFGTTTALPGSIVAVAGSKAYVGIAGMAGPFSAPTPSAVLSLISDKANFSGVFGFDTSGEDVPPAVFSSAVDLTGFGSSLSLGSSSSAVLTGTITPAAGAYRFGNGGGALVVTSKLSGAPVQVNSDASIAGNHLLLILRNAERVDGNWVASPANDFSGVFSVTNSLAILDSASALPATTMIALGTHGYLGYTEAFTGVSSFGDFVKNRIATGTYTATSVLGIDSNDYINEQLLDGWNYSTRGFSETIDLRSLGSIYIGTTTSAALNGAIFAPTQGGANKTLSLLAARDGELFVESPLLSGNVSSVVLGSATSPYAGGKILLYGANTYSFGTNFQSGTLVLSDGSHSAGGNLKYGPLGVGTLTVPGSAKGPTLIADNSQVVLHNPIALGSTLQLGDSSYSPPAMATVQGTSVFSPNWGYNTLILDGVIGDLDAANRGSLDIYGSVALGAPNTFSNGVTLHETALMLGSDWALGTGPLTFSSDVTGISYGTTLVAYNAPGNKRAIANNLVYSGEPRSTIRFEGAEFTFSGSFSLNNDVILSPTNYPVYLNGAVNGIGRRLIGSGSNTIVLGVTSGTNTYSGGTESQSGSIVFATPGAMPATPALNAFTANSSGYIGVSFEPANLQASFLDRFNKGGTSGAIGFDTPAGATTNTFVGAIDLRGFNSGVRLGSASRAILSGTITPQSDTFAFGNGGGLLEIASPLTDAGTLSRSVEVNSFWGTPLTLRLTGANTFTGSVSVFGSGLIFGPGALPAGVTIQPVSDAYVGTADGSFAANPNGFISRFANWSQGAIIGFDGITVTGGISLANFTSAYDPEIFLGTATNATISGTITLPALQSAYRFAGYKGGQLTVDTQLSGTKGVIIGDNSWTATFGTPTNPNGTLSSVRLTGANTYTGNTTLNAGILVVASTSGTSALGSGALTISSYASPIGNRNLALLADGFSQTLSNPINLGRDLDVGSWTGTDLTLSGAITDGGALYKIGAGRLTLSGNNTFSGGVFIQGGAVDFQHGYSVGSGPVQFQNTSIATATFLESSTVNGISGDSGLDLVINLPAAGTLTVNQPFDAEFSGRFASPGAATKDLIFAGASWSPVQLRLSGASTYTATGNTTINSGVAIVAANANAFGNAANVVKLDGGKLAVDAGTILSNPLTLVSGKLGGIGTFKAPTAYPGYEIKSGLVLSPGLGGAGVLRFDVSASALILGPGGTYQWDLSDANNPTGGWDQIIVTGGVNISSSAAAPFTFRIGTVGADGTINFAANFDPALPYSWTVLTAGSVTGFSSSSQFVLDTSSFMNIGGGSFTLVPTSTALTLNFSPVPEPSTYALMLAGLGLTVLAYRRRKSVG